MDTTVETRAPITDDVDAIVIGAGFAGLYMNQRLRDQMGLRVQVFETGDGVGGTWYWNRYPGARCDSESYIYCYSFDKDLMQEWEWSGKYPEQPEILRYLNHVADRHDLRSNIAFETRVTSAHWDEAGARWTVETDRGDCVRAQFLITAIGCLSTGQVPNIPGRDSFEGATYHTGSWPHEGVDFTGKRVGIIGTGSSGVQSIPGSPSRPATSPCSSAPPSTPSRPVTARSTRRSWTRSRRATTTSTSSAASPPVDSRTR